MFLSVIDQLDDRWRDMGTWRLILYIIGAVSEAVADGEAVPFGGHVRIEGEGIAFLVEAQDILDTGLVSP